MFKDEYIKDNEKILPDESVKRYIKAKMKTRTGGTVRSRLNVVVAVCLTLALAIGVTFTAEFTKTPPIAFDGASLAQGVTYEGLFASIDEIIKKNKGNIFEEIADGISLYSKDEVGTASEMATGGSASDLGENSSQTNNQVAGVDESDLVKNDGRYIYSLKDDTLIITDSNDGNMKLVSKTVVAPYKSHSITGLYVEGERLAVIMDDYSKSSFAVKLVIFDISDKANVKEIKTVEQSGSYADSRLVNGTVYLLSNYYVRNISEGRLESFVPCVDGTVIGEKDICVIEDFSRPTYLVISAISLENAEFKTAEAVLGGAENVYCDNDSLYYTFTDEVEESQAYKNQTTVVKLKLDGMDISTAAIGKVDGTPLNQFAMDEYEGKLRIVTTLSTTRINNYGSSQTVSFSQEDTTNGLYVLNDKLEIVGKIENLAEGERVYSVRFDGDIGYFVTFKQIDPLFTVDLSDPEKPTVLSELKIPGFSEYLHPFGEGLLFGFGKSATEQGLETGLKISMFDVSNPADVSERFVTPIDAQWSEASSNHKAIMVDKAKNIISFVATDSSSKTNLYVYGYDENDGFFLKNKTVISDSYTFNTRVLWIEDYFYLVSADGITSFSLNGFVKQAYLQF